MTVTPDVPMVTGYYRYTDIWFEWSQSLPNPEDADPLRAIFAHDSIVDPESPLHEDGIVGVKMYIGTLPSGEYRLLFSSAQVEYARYWLHAMKLTKEPIPIPYSDCLFTRSDLREVSPAIFRTGGELKMALKNIAKTNKRLKGVSDELNTKRDLFERVRTFFQERVGVWCSIDFEAWDRDHSVVTQVGWSSVRWENGQEIVDRGHWVIDKHRFYSNSFIPQPPERYNFGKTEILDKPTFKARLQELITRYNNPGPLYLVFHDCSQDLKYLQSRYVEAPIENISRMLPDATPDDGMFVVDTSELFSALEGDDVNEKKSLERMCRLLHIQTVFLHNAGNDAEYTMKALKTMADGEPLDLQRERRWPEQKPEGELPTKSSVKVNFKPWEEDPDYSDTEGVIGQAVSHEEEIDDEEFEEPGQLHGGLVAVPIPA